MRHHAPPAPAHCRNFDVKAWKASDEMLKWKSDYIDNLRSKRPKVLVIVGPPRCGKTVGDVFWTSCSKYGQVESR
jgi:hypothetical protein